MKRLLVVAVALFMVLGLANLVRANSVRVLNFGLDIDNDPSTFENNIILSVGDSITVDLYVTNMEDPGLQSFGFDLVYDAALLGVTNANIGPDWNFGVAKLDYSTDGLVEMAKAYFNFDPPPYGLSGNVLLGSITFRCEALGLSMLTIYDEHRDGNDYADFAMAITGKPLDDQITNGVIIGSINNVPIPSTLLLLGTGLISFLGLSRRRIAG